MRQTKGATTGDDDRRVATQSKAGQAPPWFKEVTALTKGAASALYGPSALGGVINLVSRRPGDEVETEILANLTSRDGQDLTAYAITPPATRR